jgi:NitT/TauT family transport system permease protein
MAIVRPSLMIIGLLAFVLIWGLSSFFLARSELPIATFLPGPIAVAREGLRLVSNPSFWNSFIASNSRILLAFFLAMIVGVGIGLLTAWRSEVRALLQPTLVLLRYTPVAAIVPLSIVFFGVGDFQKVVVLFFGCVFYIVVLTQDAILRFPIAHIDSARTLGLTRLEILRRVVVPGIAPEIFDTARVAIGLTWSYLLVAEVVAAESGMGFLLIRAQRFLRIDQMLFVMLVLALTGLIYDYFFVLTRRYIFPWAQ